MFSSGVIAAAGVTTGDSGLISSFTVNVSSWDVGKATAYGFKSTESGSVSPTAIELADGDTYTLDQASWGDTTNKVELSFSTTGTTDTDADAFKRLIVTDDSGNEKVYIRSTQGTHTSSTDTWEFSDSTNRVGTSGTATFELRSD